MASRGSLCTYSVAHELDPLPQCVQFMLGSFECHCMFRGSPCITGDVSAVATVLNNHRGNRAGPPLSRGTWQVQSREVALITPFPQQSEIRGSMYCEALPHLNLANQRIENCCGLALVIPD